GVLPERSRRLGGAVGRAARLLARRHAGGAGGRPRLLPRGALRPPRSRPPLPAPNPALGSARGAQAAPPATGPRRPGAVLDRLRGDRLVDLLRAGDHRAAGARLRPGPAVRDRPPVLARLALLRRGHRSDP